MYAFGEKWSPSKPHDKYFTDIPDQGIHDIHMNQGNPRSGGFSNDNGVWQDGGMLINYPSSGNWVAIFLRFQSQAIHTDDVTGHPVTATQPVPDPSVPGTPTPAEPGPVTVSEDSLVKIVAALVNPKGQEEGNEKVLLFNPTESAIDLKDWSLANNMKKKETLSGLIPSGGTLTIQLSKNTPLSNKGGIISLLEAKGLKVDGVSYTKEQASKEGRWITF